MLLVVLSPANDQRDFLFSSLSSNISAMNKKECELCNKKNRIIMLLVFK